MMLQFLHSYMYLFFLNIDLVISRTFSNLNEVKNLILPPGIFLTILGRGPRAFLIGTISEVNLELGNFKF